MPRRKAPRQLAPQTIEEATQLAAEYAEMQSYIEAARADTDAAIAQLQATRDALIAPVEQAAEDKFRQLRAWWGVAGGELTGGKRKSIELGGCILGERTTPPSLAIGKMKVADAVAAVLRLAASRLDSLRRNRLTDLIRVKRELDKPAILKELATEDLGPLLTKAGFSPKQKEEFFIDRAAPKSAATETVEVDQAA
ncbi:MAG TPA: host-nuclease inhibitor Gam family protein [Allosphingosinicella sp.]|nr:host-nuclease inhibitor Gam family protein [Allosphingosinicella sp.]